MQQKDGGVGQRALLPHLTPHTSPFPLPHTQELRDEYFGKVERYFLSGLRATSPAMRADFFALYHAQVSCAGRGRGGGQVGCSSVILTASRPPPHPDPTYPPASPRRFPPCKP